MSGPQTPKRFLTAKMFVLDDLPFVLPRNKVVRAGDVSEHPWDPPTETPRYGDPFRRRVYQAVGHALTCWEEIEARLTMLYLKFLGAEFRPDGKAALEAFERAPGTLSRMMMMKAASTAYFIKVVDQDLEGEYDRVSELVQLFAPRRNDIAHGVVRQLEMRLSRHGKDGGIEDYVYDTGFVLTPISQLQRRVGPNADKPFFFYTSSDIQKLSTHFVELRARIDNVYLQAPVIEEGLTFGPVP